jgi:hypothetical protein
MRPRRPVIRHGVGHGPRRCGGACRAFVPARRPAVARVDLLTRTVSATFGRLDGLLGGCGNLLRQAIPGGAPHGIVPIGTRTQSAQYRVLHARRCATSRALRSKAGPFSFGGAWLRHARCGEPAAASGSAAAAATEAGAGTAPGPGAATVSGHGPRSPGSVHGPSRTGRPGAAAASGTGVATAAAPEARCGHGDRSSVTGSVTDQGVAENQRQGQRQGQEQLQQQQTAPGTGTVTDTGHGPRSPGSVTDRAVAGHLVLRCTGLPSRSALVAPPFRLAALRWREVIFIFVRIQPPPSVSTACLVAVTHVPGRPFPGEPHTVLCPSKLERNRHNTVYCTPAGARILVLRRGRDSRTTGSHEVANRRRGAPGAHGSGAWHPPVALRSKAGPFSFGGAWLRHARCGEPAAASGSAAAAAAGAAAGTAPGPGAATVSGHGPRSPGSVTDRAAPEDQELRQLDPGQTHSRTHGSVRAVNPRMR